MEDFEQHKGPPGRPEVAFTCTSCDKDRTIPVDSEYIQVFYYTDSRKSTVVMKCPATGCEEVTSVSDDSTPDIALEIRNIIRDGVHVIFVSPEPLPDGAVGKMTEQDIPQEREIHFPKEWSDIYGSGQ